MDVQEWDSELYDELLTRDCVWDETTEFVYWWTKNRKTIKRCTPELLSMKLIVRYDAAKKPDRTNRLSWMAKKRSAIGSADWA